MMSGDQTISITARFREEEPEYLSKRDYEANVGSFVEYTEIKYKTLWTDALIRKYLGNPDYLVDLRGTIMSVSAIDCSPYIKRIYRKSRVAEAKASAGWKADTAKVSEQRNIRAKAKEKPEFRKLTCILCEHENAMKAAVDGWKCKYCGFETRTLD